MAEIIKVVPANFVEAMSRDGWTLKETLANAQEVENHRDVEQLGFNRSDGTWVPEICRTTRLAVTRPLFVMCKDVDVVARETELEGTIATLNLLVENQRKTLVAKDVEIAQAKKDALVLATTKDAAVAAEVRAIKELEAQMAVTNEHTKLLALIRKEIGEAKWRELEGSHTSCVHCIARQT